MALPKENKLFEPSQDYSPEVQAANILLAEFVNRPDEQIHLSREQRQLFYNQPSVYLERQFVNTSLFREIYGVAEEVFYRTEPNPYVVIDLAGALFQAYGTVYLMQEFGQDGFISVHDRERLLQLKRTFSPKAEIIKEDYERSLRGVTVPDGLILISREGEHPRIEYECEFTTANRSKKGKKHIEHTCENFDLSRGVWGMGDLYMPTASLLYVVPTDFKIDSPNGYPFVDVLHTPASKSQWRAFIDYVLFEYRPDGDLTLAEKYEIATGERLPKNERRALQYPVDITLLPQLDREMSVEGILQDEGLDDSRWNGRIPGFS